MKVKYTIHWASVISLYVQGVIAFQNLFLMDLLKMIHPNQVLQNDLLQWPIMDINGSGAFHRGIESEEAGRCTPRRLFATFDINLQKKTVIYKHRLKKGIWTFKNKPLSFWMSTDTVLIEKYLYPRSYSLVGSCRYPNPMNSANSATCLDFSTCFFFWGLKHGLERL